MFLLYVPTLWLPIYAEIWTAAFETFGFPLPETPPAAKDT